MHNESLRSDVQIQSIEIENFRSLRHLRIDFEPLTKLLGANNAGKSSVLSAIELFFDPSPKISELDHFGKDIRQPITITIRFDRLTPLERDEFASALIDGRLTVTRTFSYADTEANGYSVAARANPEFNPIRLESGAKKLAAYRLLADQYHGELPSVRSVNDVDEALKNWELAHPERLAIEKIRSFYGATNVANGKLLKKTAVRLVPAVKEVSGEFKDPKKSPIISLLSDISRQSLENQEDLRRAIEAASATITDLMDPSRNPQLANISGQLTTSLQKYYSGCRIDAEWILGKTIDFVPPVPRIQVESNGLVTPIDNVGHGLQRAVLFSLIEFLASNALKEDAEDGFFEPASDIILLIEEPEIYQHPSKQMTISAALTALTESFNRQNGIRIQIVLSTHSEKFVDLKSLSNIRILRKSNSDGEYRSICQMCNLPEIINEICQARFPPQDPMPTQQFVSKLHIFNREVSEGFFAEKVVLVEGVGDRAAMQSVFQLQDRNPEAEGVAVIQVDGKTKIDKPWVIFRKLGIPTYVVFDNDVGKNLRGPDLEDRKNYNKLLQRLGGRADAEDFPVGVYSTYCALNGNLETRVKRSLGQHCDEILIEVAEEFGVTIDTLCKSPAAVRAIFSAGNSRGIQFEEFREILAAIDALS
jgi:putative ATP-dependent endonuclease of OLD family